MIAGAISRTISQLFSPPFRSVLWKSIGLTLAMLIGLWFLVQAASSVFLLPMLSNYSWLAAAFVWILGAGLILGMGFLIAPVTSVFAGVFLDEIAEEVEATYYPGDNPGQALSVSRSIGITARFFGLVLLGNIAAFMLVMFLGLGVLVFFLLNGYLLGREYFQFAALRHHTSKQVETLRQNYSFEVFVAGLAIAVVLSIPIVNLLTPLFAGALMVHVYKGVAAKAASSAT